MNKISRLVLGAAHKSWLLFFEKWSVQRTLHLHIRNRFSLKNYIIIINKKFIIIFIFHGISFIQYATIYWSTPKPIIIARMKSLTYVYILTHVYCSCVYIYKYTRRLPHYL